MPYKPRTKLCPECNNSFTYTFPKTFCSSSCAAKHNNRKRKEQGWKRSPESLARVSKSMKKYYAEHPEARGGFGSWCWSEETKQRVQQRFDAQPQRVQEWLGDKRISIALDITRGDLKKYRSAHPVCEICGGEEYITTGKKEKNLLSIDHQHGINHFRGLLCQRCNSKLGWFEKHRHSVLQYLEEKSISRGDA